MALARDVMTKALVTIGPDLPVAAVAELLLERRISAVPVVDQRQHLLGMIGEGDLIHGDARSPQPRWWLRLLAAWPGDLVVGGERRAGEVMSTDVVTVEPDEGLPHLIELLAKSRIKRVPVVEAERLVGIVSRVDVLRHLSRSHAA